MSTAIKEAILSQMTKKAWCNPSADRQYTFKPARITKSFGARHVLRLPHIEYVLPQDGRKYAVYEIGQLPPYVYGFDGSDIAIWNRIDTLAQKESMVFNPMINHRQLPLSSVYIKRSEANSTIIAVDLEINKELLSSGYPLIFRTYNNYWYTGAGNGLTVGVKYFSKVIASNQDIQDALDFVTTHTALGYGWFQYFHNSLYTDGIVASDIAMGDSIDIIFDSSGDSYFDVSRRDFKSFVSSIDGTGKYIVQTPDEVDITTVRFYDDLDFYVCSMDKWPSGADKVIGVHAYRQRERDVRMLTHKDYSFDTDLYSRIITQQDGDINFRDSFIRVFRRRPGVERTLIRDGNYMRDLYLLPKATRLQLHRGTLSNISVWHAASLEASAYSKWMALPAASVNYSNINNVLSWDGLFDISQTITKVSATTISLPLMMNNGGSIYMFDDLGELSNVYTIPSDQIGVTTWQVLPTEVNGFVVPGKMAQLSQDLDLTAPMLSDRPTGYADRRYFKLGTGGWNVAKAGVDFTYNANGSVNWAPKHASSSRVKRSCGLYYQREVTILPKDIVVPISIWPDSTMPPSRIPFGRIAVWVNGRRLIEDLNFIVDDFKVILLCRDYYDNTNLTLKVNILAWGLYGETTSVRRVGFIQHRLLGYDTTFDLTPFRHKEIYIDGLTPKRSELNYSEYDTGTPLNVKFREGAPYVIESVIGAAPIATLGGVVREQSQELAIEEEIRDYLSTHWPEPVINSNVIIPRRHQVISLLMHTLINDIKVGKLDIDFEDMTDIAVDLALRPYSDIIAKDLINTMPEWYFSFVVPVATGRTSIVTVLSREYNFLATVNRLYLQNKVQLNDHLNVV